MVKIIKDVPRKRLITVEFTEEELATLTYALANTTQGDIQASANSRGYNIVDFRNDEDVALLDSLEEILGGDDLLCQD